MPLLLHCVQRAEAQPDDASLLVDRFHDSADDERVRLEPRSIASLRPPQLHRLALGQEHDLRVDLLLSSCGLGLGHRGINRLLIAVGYLSMLSLTGIEHKCE